MDLKKILVVDDQDAICRIFQLAFTSRGYEVHTADSGEAALEILARDPIHLIFLDINLPGMNGLDLCRTIRKNIPMANIFALTGYGSLFQLSHCREAGFDDYFKKPARITDLVTAAQDGLNRLKRWQRL